MSESLIVSLLAWTVVLAGGGLAALVAYKLVEAYLAGAL